MPAGCRRCRRYRPGMVTVSGSLRADTSRSALIAWTVSVYVPPGTTAQSTDSRVDTVTLVAEPVWNTVSPERRMYDTCVACCDGSHAMLCSTPPTKTPRRFVGVVGGGRV